jgi:hypothetical protein
MPWEVELMWEVVCALWGDDCYTATYQMDKPAAAADLPGWLAFPWR